jgi:hypothetical protein
MSKIINTKKDGARRSEPSMMTKSECKEKESECKEKERKRKAYMPEIVQYDDASTWYVQSVGDDGPEN